MATRPWRVEVLRHYHRGDVWKCWGTYSTEKIAKEKRIEAARNGSTTRVVRRDWGSGNRTVRPWRLEVLQLGDVWECKATYATEKAAEKSALRWKGVWPEFRIVRSVQEDVRTFDEVVEENRQLVDRGWEDQRTINDLRNRLKTIQEALNVRLAAEEGDPWAE